MDPLSLVNALTFDAFGTILDLGGSHAAPLDEFLKSSGSASPRRTSRVETCAICGRPPRRSSSMRAESWCASTRRAMSSGSRSAELRLGVPGFSLVGVELLRPVAAAGHARGQDSEGGEGKR